MNERKTVVELCPHCGNEIEMFWEVERLGYKAYCPVCGKRLMLCDECQHSTGEFDSFCNFDSSTGTCLHNDSKGGLKMCDVTENARRIYELFQNSKCPDAFVDNYWMLKVAKFLDEEGVIAPPCAVGETVYAITACADILMHHDNDYLTGTGAIECPFEIDCDKEECNDEQLQVVKTECSGIYQDEEAITVFLKNINRNFYLFDFDKFVFVGENAEIHANETLRRMHENVDSKENCR